MFLYGNSKTKTVSTILVVAIVFIVAFGFAMISGHNGQQTCLASSVLDNNCPPVGNSIILANHHISSLQYISQGITSIGTLFLLTFILSILVLVLSLFNVKEEDERYNLRKKINRYLNFIAEYQFIHWLNLNKTLNPDAQK